MSRPHEPGPGSYATNILLRLLMNELVESEPDYWIRRAEELEAATSRRSDTFPGRVSMADRVARNRQLSEAALACRRRASLSEGPTPQLVADVAAAADLLAAELDQEIADAMQRLREAIARGADPDVLSFRVGVVEILQHRRNMAAARRPRLAGGTSPLEQAEAELRAAIDAGPEPAEIARLSGAVDALDPALRRMGTAA